MSGACAKTSTSLLEDKMLCARAFALAISIAVVTVTVRMRILLLQELFNLFLLLLLA